MNIFKRILGHVYFVYALLMFLITLLIVVIPVSVLNWIYKHNEVRRLNSTYRVFVIWMYVYLTLVFIFVKRKGLEHFKKGENYVVVVNHNSFADIPISSPFVPGPNKTLAKIEFMKIPVFNIIYRSGSILVDRSSEESRKTSVKEMIDTLHMGAHLTLYPEGTRNTGSKPLQPFYDGAFRTAISSQKGIVPGILFGTRYILPNRPKFWAWPHTVRFEFLAPVPTEGLQVSDAKALKDKVYNIMYDYILKHQ